MITPPSDVSVWAVIGTALAGIAGSIATYYRGRGSREAENAHHAANATSAFATRDVIERLDSEVRELRQELTEVRVRERRLIMHVIQLAAIMKANGIDPPPFDFGQML